MKENLYDVYLNIDYIAEMGDLYLDQEKVADEFYNGEIWQVGLRKFKFPKEFPLKLYPLNKEDKIYLEKFPEFLGASISLLKKIEVEVIDKVEINY